MAMAIDNTPDRRFLIGPSLAYTGERFFQIFADLEQIDRLDAFAGRSRHVVRSLCLRPF